MVRDLVVKYLQVCSKFQGYLDPGLPGEAQVFLLYPFNSCSVLFYLQGTLVSLVQESVRDSEIGPEYMMV